MTTKLEYDEREMLKTIVRVSGDNLERNLLMWGEWLQERQRAKYNRQVHPQYPLVLLSLMGIHGREALT